MSKVLTTQNQLTPSVWDMISSIAVSMFDGRGQLGVVKQGEAAIKLLFCYENGLPLTAAVTGLYIVNKRLAVMSNLIAAKFKQHPNYDYNIKRLDNTGCVIEVLRDGEVVDESVFIESDAKQAGLLSKQVWQEYPRNMYFGRAMTNACRWYAPDLFNQPIYIPEELGMRVDSEGAPVIETGSYVVDGDKGNSDSILPILISLQDLTEEFGAEAILTANDNRIPSTQGEIDSVAIILAEGQSDAS